MAGAGTQRNWSGERVLFLSPTPTHPQDYGNRKRIFQVCSHLQSEGAEITFAHYPAEAEWRRANPRSAEQAMMRTWRQYFAIPPSRELHPLPKGTHHTIDEWWDPTIATFLQWLFSVQSFDTFIVNYAWLSKAFEYAPLSVARILDTHDKKSGRLDVLTAHGIAPEYFFTTEDQEAIALNRAHVVWAIKDQEKVHFESISRTPVVTLPHLDPMHALERPPPDPDGFLKAGFLAARNSINQVNITRFVQAAEPMFREAFAPIKLVIAGSVCDLLAGMDSPFVELRGRVDSADDFYQTVDCAVVPMTFSTGLKIKTGEAISAGLPVVATAHAFEGYHAADPLHQLPNAHAMARALVDLSFAPRTRLDELAAASFRTHTATAKIIAGAHERTRELARERQQSIVIAVDSRALVHGSVFNMVLKSMHGFLRTLGSVSVLVVRGSAAHVVEGARTVDEIGRIMVAADLCDAAAHVQDFARLHVEIVDVEAYLSTKSAKILIADALHGAFSKTCCWDTALFARTEMLALSEGRPDFDLPGKTFRRAFVITPSPSRSIASYRAKMSAAVVIAPCLNRSRELMRPLRADESGPSVVILGGWRTRGRALALSLAEAWDMRAHLVGADDGTRIGIEGVDYTTASNYIAALVSGDATAPLFAVDFSAGEIGLQLCREILERYNIPVVSAGSVGLHRALGEPSLPAVVSTEFELSEVFRAFALDPVTGKHPTFKMGKAILETDRGWAYIAGFCKRMFQAHDVDFA